ncbi:meiotic recombination [Didymosphaeria variabile]|uniref:Meiotic recombination n=1 Tax=Didymosphaeria variabile TaxID=1932322 RepID=A0A9W8XMT3_9PLEO|nr:meiotic recombination [Didymosphaeria variabile]KAJ4354439.1 meiotic recombination [Didymosphaeria variabile]
MSYKVEELLALRDSVSESAVSIEKFADEDVIKEHVLRPSASATLAAASSTKSLRSSATPSLAPAAPVKKPSPSPSIKRGKAERLLKEHGSPPGMRVTAGGRIVPSDQPPVLNPRFINNAFKPPALRGITPSSTMSAQPRLETNNIPRLEVVGSQPVLYVGDRAYALPALDATNAAASSLVPTNLESAPNHAEPVSGLSARSSFTSAALPPQRGNTPSPWSGLDLSALKAQQTMRKQELRTVEQTEVLQASHQTEAWRAGVIEKKRNLIIELDALRKQITALEANENNNAPPVPSNGFATTLGATSASMPPPPFVPQFQQPMPSPLYGFQGTPSYPPMMMFPQSFGGYPSMPATDSAPFVQNPVQVPQSPGSASRRSHAIQIKPPPEESKKQLSSALDPKSPTYEPITTTTAGNDAVPPTPSPAKRSPWRTNGVPQSDQPGNRTLSQKPSLSSIDTTDFFPTNTHEHSSTRVAPQVHEPMSTTNETSGVPSTPERNWPASPWNEGNSSRSSHKAVTKLTSWPEAFGKKPSSGSLRQVAAAPTSATVQERVPLPSVEPKKSAFSSNTSGRKTIDQRFGTDETWPLISSKPINHVPSTYQEGFQAGYDHVGIPDSPDVLKGYIQGLVQFLHDEDKRGRNNSLRGLVAGSQPQDSAISMTFNRSDAPVSSQENIRSARGNPAVEMHKESAYTTPESPFVYTLPSDALQDQRMRNLKPNMYMNSAGTLDRVSPAYQQTTLPFTENGLGRKDSEKGSMSRTEIAKIGYTYRQFSGNQLTNRTYGTPVSLQRYNQTAQDYGMPASGGIPSFARPMANQRVSGLDGAMDDLAEMVVDTHITEQSHQQPHPQNPPHASAGQRPAGASGSLVFVEEDASCFRSSSSKGKQKMTSSPTKLASNERSDAAAPSPANTPGSPKKSGEHSPAKAKLEQVTNKFRRRKKDSRNLSPEQKKERAKKWRERFGQLRDEEAKNIQDYKQNHPSSAVRR